MLEMMCRRWWLVALRGVVAILFGILAIAWPGITVLALAIVWGIYALADGVGAAMVGIGDRSAEPADRWLHVVLGLLGIVVGVIALLWPGITVIALLVVIAAWAIVSGVLQISAAIRLRKVIDNEWFLALSGVLALVLGVMLIVQPATGALALVVTIGTFAIMWGIVLIVLGFRLRSYAKTLHTTEAA